MAGASAATLTLDSTCTEANHLDVTGIVTGGTYTACSSIETDAQFTGSVVLEAGNAIAFKSGLSVEPSTTVTARLTPSLYHDAYLVDDSPQFEAVYAARFWLNTGDYTPNGATRFDHFLAYDLSGDLQFRVVVGQGTGPEVFVETFDDAGAISSTSGSALALPIGGWHSIKVTWVQSSGADDGSVEVCVDETTCASLNALDNDAGFVDRVEWGARNLEGGAAGVLHLDEFESFRNTSLEE